MTSLKEKIRSHKLPLQLAELMHSNQFLKFFALGAFCVAVLSMIALLALGTRKPFVLILSANATELEQSIELPKPEREIEMAARKYIDLRYKWEPATALKRMTSASVFIHANSLRAFQTAIANIAKFSTEKQVSQRAYPENIKVNLTNKTICILGDRITSIQGMMAAGPLKLELSFESGDRTQENPWGIYITKEKEAL